MKKTITLLILLFFIISFTSCVTFRLEKQLKKLEPTIAQWYEYHKILMETKIPRWIDERGGREKVHFLRLPPTMQLAYIKMFWKMRAEGAREEYYYRVGASNKLFNKEGKPGWKTDRGQVLLLCGFPQYITHYPIFNRGGKDSDLEGYRYEVWEYYQRGHIVRYTFKYYAPDTWRGEHSFLLDAGNQADFERQCRELLAPTEDGWDSWGSLLLAWWREK